MLDAQAWRAARLVVDTGHARAPLGAPALDRLPAQRRRPVRDRRRHRDRPLHLLAGPGPDLQARPAPDRDSCGARSRRATARGSTCASSTTRSSGTGRCHSRRSPASCRPGWPRRPDPAPRDLGPVQLATAGVRRRQPRPWTADRMRPAVAAIGHRTSLRRRDRADERVHLPFASEGGTIADPTECPCTCTPGGPMHRPRLVPAPSLGFTRPTSDSAIAALARRHRSRLRAAGGGTKTSQAAMLTAVGAGVTVDAAHHRRRDGR